MLLDNVFLEIFKFCLCNDFLLSDDSFYHKRKWQTLVHVCQRWQILIFASPHQLELYLSCANRVSVRKNLGFWPVTLPLSLFYCHQITPEDEDNIVAILDYPSHVHSIKIHARAPLIKKVVAAMQKSFPMLIHLVLMCYPLVSDPSPIPVIPRMFLGGSVPYLQHLSVQSLSFPHW
jgi:hypothetical protein